MIPRSLRAEVLKLKKSPPTKLSDASTSKVQEQAQSTSGQLHMANDGYVQYNVPDGGEDEAVYQDINTGLSTVTDGVTLDGSNVRSEDTGAVTEESAYASKILQDDIDNENDISPYGDTK